MKKTLSCLAVCLMVLACIGAPALAQDDNPVRFANKTKSNAAPLDIAMEHINRSHMKSVGGPAALGEIVINSQTVSKHNGTHHFYFMQKVNGLEIVNSLTNVNVAADGQVINMGDRLVRGATAKAAVMAPTLGAADAILAAADHLGLTAEGEIQSLRKAAGVEKAGLFTPSGVSREAIPTKLVYYALEDGSLRLAWDLQIQTPDQRHWYNMWIDAADGSMLDKSDWMSWESYEAFAIPKESPDDGPRTIETNPADATASPFGWHDTDGVAGPEFTDTRGNNVSAQEDRDGNNSGGFRPDGGATLDFLPPLDLSQSPVDYQDAAIVNLFYWNNIIHDLLYQYGFDEASGNFQENNYGRGGSGSDSVNADAQDGSGTNNANFATPPDGSNPRMQMFEWTPSATALVTVSSPAGIAGDYTAAAADFGAALTSTGVSGTFEYASPADGCTALSGFTAGRIAVIDRGNCEFGIKALNAENAGAIAAIIVNNQGDGVITMGPGANGGSVSIESVMIGQGDGDTIKAELANGVNGTVKDAGGAIVNRDSDLDNGIIAHEYCHGLSIRLTGGAGTSNCLSGAQQGGEGWSDFCALVMTPDASDTGATPRGVGNYAIFEPSTGAGIRQYPYTTDMSINPHTYAEVPNVSQPHGVGSIWNAMLWEVYWALTDEYGFDADLYNGTGGNNMAIQLVVDGLKLQPCNPSFTDARDAILLADQNNNGGANQCLIWSAFAKRGLGVDANDGGGANSTNVTENFDVPLSCIEGCGNLVCEVGEDCTTCPTDCPSGSTSGAVCGNGICEAGNGENCVTCAADCNGTQGGKPANRFCCGDGGGDSPVACSDSRCSSGGNSCTDIPVAGGSFCCGDLTCDVGESCSTCALDCTAGIEICDNGIDDDCDGLVDCADNDCLSAPSCQGGTCTLGQAGDSCSDGTDCCSGSCSGGKPSTRVCL